MWCQSRHESRQGPPADLTLIVDDDIGRWVIVAEVPRRLGRAEKRRDGGGRGYRGERGGTGLASGEVLA